jgi:hypothetical protein
LRLTPSLASLYLFPKASTSILRVIGHGAEEIDEKEGADDEARYP